MQISRRRLTAWLLLTLVLCGALLSGCSSAPTTKQELAQFKERLGKIEPDFSLLMDSFQALMMRKDMAQLHQMELKAATLEKDWAKSEYHQADIADLQSEMSLALIKLGGGYGLGYIYVLRGGKETDTEGKAIDEATEGINHYASVHKKLMEVEGKVGK